MFSGVDLSPPSNIISFGIAAREIPQVVGLSRWKIEIDLGCIQRFKDLLHLSVGRWSRRQHDTRAGYLFDGPVYLFNNKRVGIDFYDHERALSDYCKYMSLILRVFSFDPDVHIVIYSYNLRLKSQPCVIVSFLSRLHLVELVFRSPHGLLDTVLPFPFEVFLGLFFCWHWFKCKRLR